MLSHGDEDHFLLLKKDEQKVLRKYVKIDTNKKLLLKQQTELQKHKLGKKLTIGLM